MNDLGEVKKVTDVSMEGPITRGLRFRLKKFLLRMNLIEQEEKLLEKEVHALDADVKQQKIKNIINKF